MSHLNRPVVVGVKLAVSVSSPRLSVVTDTVPAPPGTSSRTSAAVATSGPSHGRSGSKPLPPRRRLPNWSLSTMVNTAGRSAKLLAGSVCADTTVTLKQRSRLANSPCSDTRLCCCCHPLENQCLCGVVVGQNRNRFHNADRGSNTQRAAI